MLVRFAYLAVAHAFTALRLLPMTDRKVALLVPLSHATLALARSLGVKIAPAIGRDAALITRLTRMPPDRIIAANLRRHRLHLLNLSNSEEATT